MTTMLASAQIQQLTERIRDWRADDVLVDGTNRSVRNVALTAADSRNGYRYSEQALRNAVPLYENKPVFLDHAANLSRPFERSTRDLVGSIVNPRFQEGRIRADIQTLDTESGRTFIALAESETPSVGMSHVVLAERGRDKAVVEQIHDVISVDAVVFPATASTFRENLQEQHAMFLPGCYESILKSVDAKLPEHIQQLQEEEFSQVRRLGLFPDQVLIEAIREENSPAEYYSLDWWSQDNEILLGEELTAIPSDAIHDDIWIAEQLHRRSQPDPLQTELEQVTAERDQLQRQIAQFERDRQEADRHREIDQLLTEADLPAEFVTDAFRNQLLSAEDTSTRRELLSERRELVQRLSRKPPASRERGHGRHAESSDAAIVSAVKGQRRAAPSGARL